MSDIVIRGMEMPKGNDYLHLIIQNGKVHKAISCGYISTDELNVADAVELPPHGDLKDVNKIIEGIFDIVAIQDPIPQKLSLGSSGNRRILGTNPERSGSDNRKGATDLEDPARGRIHAVFFVKTI